MEDRPVGTRGGGLPHTGLDCDLQCKQRHQRNRCCKGGRMCISSLPPLALNRATVFMKQGNVCRSSYKLADQIKRVIDPWFQAS